MVRRLIFVAVGTSVALFAIYWLVMPPKIVKPAIVVIGIDANCRITWNEKTMSSRDQLDENMALAAKQAVQPMMHIQPNKGTKYRCVAEVLADAQRMGLQNFGFVGNEQYISSP